MRATTAACSRSTGGSEKQLKAGPTVIGFGLCDAADEAQRAVFVGAALVLSLYALMIWRTLRILTLAKNLFGALIAGGIVAMLMFQVFVNVGMTVGIMPITGVTLPLLSYGGSSVLTTFLALGLLQSIYVQARTSAALKGRVLRF